MKILFVDDKALRIRRDFRILVVILWAIALSVFCIRVTVQVKHQHSGYFVYVDAGRAWRSGGHLYTSLDDLPPAQRERARAAVAAAGEAQERESGAWGGFRYSPTAALLFSPLSYIPMGIGEILWRFFLAGVSLGGLLWCARVGIPTTLAWRDWSVLFLLVLWHYGTCLNNGQSSCIIIGCLLAAVAACYSEYWTLAALLVVIPTTLKLYPVSFGMLLAMMYPRRFGWRFVLVLIAAFALPFLLRPTTMLEEHRRWWWHLVNDAKTLQAVTSWDQDVRLLLYRYLRIHMSDRAFLIMQALVAMFIAGVCAVCRLAGMPMRLLLPRTLGLATVWMTSFGMATEPSTYILISPVLAWSIWEVWLRPTRKAEVHGGSSPGGWGSHAVLYLAFFLLILAYIFLWFKWGKIANSYGNEPLAGLLLMGYLLARTVREVKAGGGVRLSVFPVRSAPGPALQH